MSPNVITINGKKVLLANPYTADTPDGLFVGRESERRLVEIAWHSPNGKQPKAPILVGEPGQGKTAMVLELARSFGRDLYLPGADESVRDDDMACIFVLNDDENQPFDYKLSSLATAMHVGGICFIDEIEELRTNAFAKLLSVLDGRQYIESTLLGEKIHAHKNFRFIAATNNLDAFRPKDHRRLRTKVNIGPATPEQIQKIIISRFDLHPDNGGILCRYWDLWHKREPTASPTPDDAIYIFDMAENIAAIESQEMAGVPMQLESNGHACIEPRHLDEAFALL